MSTLENKLQGKINYRQQGDYIKINWSIHQEDKTQFKYMYMNKRIEFQSIINNRKIIDNSTNNCKFKRKNTLLNNHRSKRMFKNSKRIYCTE